MELTDTGEGLPRSTYLCNKNECFWGYTGISLSVRVSVCQSVYKIIATLCHALLRFCCHCFENLYKHW